jgi:hypothetical protein
MTPGRTTVVFPLCVCGFIKIKLWPICSRGCTGDGKPTLTNESIVILPRVSQRRKSINDDPHLSLVSKWSPKRSISVAKWSPKRRKGAKWSSKLNRTASQSACGKVPLRAQGTEDGKRGRFPLSEVPAIFCGCFA